MAKRATAAISAVAPKNNQRDTLIAIRDRLAAETDDTMWSAHKRECECVCGMGDGRLLVALVKELRAVESELAAMPAPSEANDLDTLADELATRRASRRSVAAS